MEKMFGIVMDLDECKLLAELKAIEGESIGWQPMEQGAYLHVGNPDEEEVVITVTGVPQAWMADLNVLLLT